MVFLATKTAGDARKVVRSRDAGRGLEAWRRLVRWYEKRVATEGLQAHINFTMMSGQKAKDVKELKGLLVEFDGRRKKVEATGKRVDDDLLATVLQMMLDPDTKRGTMKEQTEGYEALRKAVDDHVRMMTGDVVIPGGRRGDKMDVGAVGWGRLDEPWKVSVDGVGDDDGGWKDGDLDEAEAERLAALGKGGGKGKGNCFECGKAGHFARECPNKGGSKTASETTALGSPLVRTLPCKMTRLPTLKAIPLSFSATFSQRCQSFCLCFIQIPIFPTTIIVSHTIHRHLPWFIQSPPSNRSNIHLVPSPSPWYYHISRHHPHMVIHRLPQRFVSLGLLFHRSPLRVWIQHHLQHRCQQVIIHPLPRRFHLLPPPVKLHQ
jgi:hypothetical protein